MLVVTVALHSARTGKTEVLGQAIIDNTSGGGTGRHAARADYRVRVGRKGSDLRAIAEKPQREGEVRNYPRLSYSVWRLVIRALLSAFPEERA